jgi:hypothetical protein
VAHSKSHVRWISRSGCRTLCRLRVWLLRIQIVHKTMGRNVKKRFLNRENFIVGLCAAATLALVLIADHNGLPRKWHTAIFGTVVPFSFVLASYASRWRRWSFWVAFAICFVVHSVAIWVLFQYLILGVAPGWDLWTPIVIVESFLLLVTIKIIENKLLGKHPHTISL